MERRAALIFTFGRMHARRPFERPALEDRTFLLLVAAVTIAFIWILSPFYGAVLWGAAIAILFAPVERRLDRRFGGRKNLAAATTLLGIIVVVIAPLTLLGVMLVNQAVGVFARIQSGELDLQQLLVRMGEALPGWVSSALNRAGIENIDDLQQRVASGVQAAAAFLGERLLAFGQNTFSFLLSVVVMLYLLFFLLRDGDTLARRFNEAIPLHTEERRALTTKFTAVIRAMIKGTLAVAVAQGALGGVAFWLLGLPAPALWGVVMGVLSLLPAVGALLVWAPVAGYLLISGAVWKGLGLLAYGTLVISTVDNLLRPILVGKDTKIPDYIVLISTLGGVAIFGANGLLLGPVIAALFLAAWDIFTESRRDSA